MRTAERVQASGRAARRAASSRAFEPGETVVLRRPWHLRRRPAVVRRRVTRGWEVEVRTALGTPLHLVVPARALRRR